jgi:hypothetical protein
MCLMSKVLMNGNIYIYIYTYMYILYGNKLSNDDNQCNFCFLSRTLQAAVKICQIAAAAV